MYIHMNGRAYDYNLGRFLSVDPFVHEGSQGMNPYSYIMNNPLAGTDPTGYVPVGSDGEPLKKAKPKIKKIKKNKRGSRIKETVAVTQDNGDGTRTTIALVGDGKVAISNGSSKGGAAAALGGLNRNAREAGVVDLGSLSAVATSGANGASAAAGVSRTQSALTIGSRAASAAALADSPAPGPGDAIGILILIGTGGYIAWNELAEKHVAPPFGMGSGATTTATPPEDPDDFENIDRTADLEMSRRASSTKLRGQLNLSRNDGMRAHHLIPWEFRNHAVVRAAARGGFEFNGRMNGVALTRGQHPGSHPMYNRGVQNYLNGNFRGMSDREIAKNLAGHAGRLRRVIPRLTRDGKLR